MRSLLVTCLSFIANEDVYCSACIIFLLILSKDISHFVTKTIMESFAWTEF